LIFDGLLKDSLTTVEETEREREREKEKERERVRVRERERERVRVRVSKQEKEKESERVRESGLGKFFHQFNSVHVHFPFLTKSLIISSLFHFSLI
jgi:hypothetical protein